jgi:peptide/nickel transport system substrate-binding protein
MNKSFRNVLLVVVFLALTLPACGPQVTDIPTVAETATSVAPALNETVSPTPATRSLTVCLGEEPNTLYPYGNPNAAARSVLSAIYDGPIDVVEYGYEPIILEKVPNLEDGDAQVTPVSVGSGEQVVDASGNLTALSKGTRVRPSGCRSGDCAITYDGSSTIQMDQLVVTFTMLEDLMWSDGEPITADDSVFSYQLASDAAGSKYVIDRTAIYEAADEYTIQWWGKPGFTDPDYFMNFWMPLPEHAWAEFPPADLAKLDISSRMPIGWGPYIIDEWEAGKQLHFVRNLNYFRAESGLPKFDELTFLIQPDADTALSALVDGTCDVLDPSLRLDAHVGLLQQMEKDNRPVYLSLKP